MKSVFSILFLTIYLVSTIGVSIVIHTCSGVSTTNIALSEVEDPCGCDLFAPEEMCCTLEIKTVKLDDAQLFSSVKFEQPLEVVFVLPMFSETPFSGYKQIVESTDTSPPFDETPYITNSVLLI